jgi:phospholipid N-methyltransferase
MRSFWKNKKINNLIFNNYDYFVNNINCKYVWKCDQRYIKKLYANNITNKHLEIGPGTGYFIKKYQFNNLHLVDINQDILTNSKKNLNNNCQNIKIHNQNIFENNNKINEDITSIGMSYVLHCVPSNLDRSLDNLVENIKANNQVTIFGSTVIPNKKDFLAMTEIYTLNKLGIFNNINHNKEQLEYIISKYNGNVKHVGNVLLFNFTL